MHADEKAMIVQDAKLTDADSPSSSRRGFLEGLHLSRRSGLSVQAQLQAQIRYALATGTLRPGDPLPSINELADRLSINRNTVHQTYQRLRTAGFLDLEQGRGVFVSGASSPFPDTAGLSSLIERTLREAVALGVSPLAFSHYLQSQAHSFEARCPLVAFVECNLYQTDEFSSQIGQRWQMNVVPVLLSTLTAQERQVPDTCKLVLTTYFHYPEVRDRLQSQGFMIRPVVLDVISGLKETLQAIPTAARAGVVSRFEGVHDIEDVIERARASGLDISAFAFHDGDDARLKRFLRGLDVVVCPDAARDAVMRLKPARAPQIIEWKAKLDVAQLDALRESVPLLHDW